MCPDRHADVETHLRFKVDRQPPPLHLDILQRLAVI
jgi:hypothetical protein